MNRTTKLLMLALNAKKDADTLNTLQIPNYDSTKGLSSNEINILFASSKKITPKTCEVKSSLADTQIQDISSTEKVCITREMLRKEQAKKQLFGLSEEENTDCMEGEDKVENRSNRLKEDIISSTFDEEVDQYEDSGSEYIPESENESETDCINSDIEIKAARSIVVSETVMEDKSSQLTRTSKTDNQVDVSANKIPEKTNGVIPKGKKRVWNKKDLCVFCDVEVMKFSRHILRHHQAEFEVQEILALKVCDKKRKLLFNKLRNRGNFLKSITGETVVPIKNLNTSDTPTAATYLPCKYCKGFYKKKYLYRHLKSCPHKNTDETGKIMAQSEGQSLFSAYKKNDILREKVFPTMRADPISLVAKTDTLICTVARRYLKSHREKQFVAVASRKMRQLATLLIEIKKKVKVKNLFNALDPSYFDCIVQCTKIISKYDAETETYGAPSLALHMGTELKDCIDVAYSMSLKKFDSENEVTAKLKSLKELIVSEWRYEISTLANNDLQRKHWNRPSMIPLAEDLTLLKSYSVLESEKFRNILNADPTDDKAFKNLQELTYVQLLLLNRRRIGELQRMTVTSYTSNISNEISSEFDSCISESERVLMRSFKNIVIRGKRGRGVPVLFTDNMVKNVDLLLKLRKNFVQHNLYLFANTVGSTPISGYKAMYKHVRQAGAKNPHALTSTKLRKHLATMSQVINLSEQDLEQLANFMGHTSEIHKTYYRLPNDVYQMAKVSKLLLLSEKGEAAKYKGKRLDEIDIELDVVEEQNGSDSEDCEIEDTIEQEVKEKNSNLKRKKTETQVKTQTVPKNFEQQKKKRILQPWTDEQKNAALSYFKTHLKKKIPPKKGETLLLIEQAPGLFKNKTWEKIKIFIVNTYNKT